MAASSDHVNAVADAADDLNTQDILKALAADADVQKLCTSHPGLTEERVRACLREAATWAAREYVEPTLREKLLNALLLPFLAAVAALSYIFMRPLVYRCYEQYCEMDLGPLPDLSIWFVEYHQRIGWMVMLIAFLSFVYALWVCRRRWRVAFFRRAAGLVGGLYAAWVILAVLLPIIVISARIGR